MSLYYLVDRMTGEMQQVRSANLHQYFRSEGYYVVPVPDGVRIEDPADVTDLLTQIRDGIAARYPGFFNYEVWVPDGKWIDAIYSGVESLGPYTHMSREASSTETAVTGGTPTDYAIYVATFAVQLRNDTDRPQDLSLESADYNSGEWNYTPLINGAEADTPSDTNGAIRQWAGGAVTSIGVTVRGNIENLFSISYAVAVWN